MSEGVQVPMEDLHQKLGDIAPNSDEEKRILEEARARKEHKTDEFRIIRNEGLKQTAEHGVIDPTAAQHVAHVAIEKAGGRQEIPVEVIQNPDKMH